MVQCLGTVADGSRCTKTANFPADAPLVCGNHKFKINDDGEFDDSLKKKAPATPEKPELNVVKPVEDHAELMQLASEVVGIQSDLLTITTVKQKNDVVIKIAYKKAGASPSPAIAQQLQAKDDRIAELEAKLAAAGIKEGSSSEPE
jgi:hypothetical protein